MATLFRTKIRASIFFTLTIFLLFSGLVSAYASVDRAIDAHGNVFVGLKSNGTVVANYPEGRTDFYGQTKVGSWSNIVAIAAGGMHTVGLKSDGTVVSVGNNSNGQGEVSGWTDIVSITTGSRYTLGLKSDGSTVIAGDLSPDAAWTNISAIAGGYSHSAGLKEDGTVVLAGSDSFGSRAEVSSWTDITEVAAGNEFTVGLKSNGTVVAAGNNIYRQLRVSDWTNITQIAAGKCCTVGLRSDGTVVYAGNDYDVQREVSGWTGITAITAGVSDVYGLKSNGTVVYAGDKASWNQYILVPELTKSISKAIITNVPHYAGRTGSYIKPVPKVTYNGTKLTRGVHYEVEYKYNKSIGTAYVIVKGVGKFYGKKTKSFHIIGLTSLSKTTYAKRTLKPSFSGGTGKITWRSSNRDIATVSSTGVVKTLRSGKVKISATRNGVKSICTITVKKLPCKVVGLKRTVSNGTGYISATVKTLSSKPIKGRLVRFYRGSTYIGRARTDSEGKARIKVTKNRYRKKYKAVVAANGVYSSEDTSRYLVFIKRVYTDWDSYMIDDYAYLKKGTYRIDFSEDSNGGSEVHWVYTTAEGKGATGSADFIITKAGYVNIWGLSDWVADWPWIEVVVYRYL